MSDLFKSEDCFFRLHEKLNGYYYGAMWRGEIPKTWSPHNLVKLTEAEFAPFTPVSEDEEKAASARTKP